ncbi:hypothetical protein DFS30_01185 [Akkermansia muciniphila]|jgi:hypothetical protein|nr:hypothetical protein [Akkermansia muciniphila]MBD9263441.1 hypothetical protein [Akkermansia muciniphila]PNC47320.1 hypothetical protein CXU08_00020 [Akkermansia muciniphila]PNC69759.1 hypothetical protein CXU02_12070 [Akkermansia muciniphila]PNC77122.1 hypothetical protein CXT98_08445 [Akkermansia muciniphila]
MDFPSAFFPRGYPPRVTAGETKTLFSSFHFPKYMRILPLLAFTCLFGSISFAQGQSRASSRPEPAQPAANAPASDTVDKSLPPAAVNGIRFVLKEPMSLPSPIYMPIDSKRLEKVEIRAALPGRRSVYPKSKIITLFGGLDQKGMPTNKLVSKPLPPDLGSKTLALVGKNSKGELTLDFINESELPLNCVYIQNLTGRTFTLELPKPPSGEKSAIELPSKSTYIFGKNSTDSNISRTTPANLTYMTRLKNGKVVKVKDRGMMLTTYPGRKVVMIISPDSTGRTVVLTELMIFKERPGAASSDK